MLSLITALLITAAPDAPPADLPACPTQNDSPDVGALLQRMERVQEGRSMVSVMKMTIKTAQYERAVKMKLWTRGRDFALVRVQEGGPRETGMMTLKREKQLWNYLPQAGRVMKLPSGMMGDSWMGSDFTNDDLVRGSSLTSDFTSVVNKTIEVNSRKAWFVTLTPKPGAKVVWGRIELTLDRDTCVPLAQRFYDEEGVVTRQLEFGDIKKVGWRNFPMTLSMVPADQTRKTTMTYESVEFDVDVPEDTFSLRRLQQGKD